MTNNELLSLKQCSIIRVKQIGDTEIQDSFVCALYEIRDDTYKLWLNIKICDVYANDVLMILKRSSYQNSLNLSLDIDYIVLHASGVIGECAISVNDEILT